MLDLRTVTVVAAAMAGLMSIVLYSVYRNFPASIRGPGPWALGSAIGFGAGFLFFLRGIVPDWISILIGNALVLAGIGLWLIGLQVFYGRRPSWLVFGATVAGGCACIAWTLFVHPGETVRLVGMTAILGGLYGAQLVLVLRHGERETSTYFLALVLLIQTLTVLTRGITALVAGEAPGAFYAPTPIQTAYLASYNFTALMLTVGFVMLATRRLQTELERHSAMDPLTGLLNRRALAAMYEQEHEAARRAGGPIALLLVDLDHFKSVNDHYGHAVGDQVLIDFSRRAAEAIPSGTPFARVGGEEFAILLPSTGIVQARAQAEGVRRAISQRVTIGLPLYTCSIGVAHSRQSDATLERLMRAADEGLYHAKSSGRNRVGTVEEDAMAQPAAPGIPMVSNGA